MKAIVCEMCGSQNLVKQDGMYICQSCGTKYSVEEAKKLMVEGTVDVTGSTVKVDNTDSLTNLRQLAKRARENGNTEQAAKYYDMIAIQDPNDWEAAFYSVYYQSANTNIAGIASAANRVTNCIPNTMQMIKSSVPQENQKAAYMQIAESVKALCKVFHNSAYNHYTKHSTVDGARSEYNQRNNASYKMVFQTASCIESIFDDKQNALGLYMYCYKSDSTLDKDVINKAITRIDPELGQKNEITSTKKAGNSTFGISILAIIGGLFGTIAGANMRGGTFLLVLGIFFLIIGVVLMIVAVGAKKQAKKLQAEFDRTHNSESK